MDNKKKVSAFEFAIMEIADPEKAKECEPYTRDEETEQRKSNLMDTAKKLKILNPSPCNAL